MSFISSEKIPNNVNLSSDRKLQRALEEWQPNFLDWWMEMGPDGFQKDQIYLRTAVSVDEGGWANFGYVRMPEYRWGIFLTPAEANRTIHFGDNIGAPAWNEVPGEYRKELRRIIVTQADTEPASVEQQRRLGYTAPSLYDLRNLFQVNVEEGRHLWAMVYLLHSFFGKDGREEAEDLLKRRSGNPDSPRILEAFNKPMEDWLSFFCFTMFTDRDGKYQLGALAESAFDPLARSTRFMLTEEAHHLFVGETGVGRIIERTAQLMKKDPNEDARAQGGIPLDLIQRYINYWYSTSLDLFGGEDSSNAATYFSQGLKGRFGESSDKRYPNHREIDTIYELEAPVEGGARLEKQAIPTRRAMNAVLRDSYTQDCQRAVDRWNKILQDNGVKVEIRLPSQRFNREIGLYADLPIDPAGNLISREAFNAQKASWLPSEADRQFLKSLMNKPVHEPGKFANWIAPPKRGIENLPVDFEYVRFEPR
ncbi:MAG: Benzoyl-CoA oxygenase component B [Myxococcota bacterium]|nr:Benzoyl-CoA oxygenase component B [Myxococcota bacterium]